MDMLMESFKEFERLLKAVAILIDSCWSLSRVFDEAGLTLFCCLVS